MHPTKPTLLNQILSVLRSSEEAGRKRANSACTSVKLFFRGICIGPTRKARRVAVVRGRGLRGGVGGGGGSCCWAGRFRQARGRRGIAGTRVLPLHCLLSPQAPSAPISHFGASPQVSGTPHPCASRGEGPEHPGRGRAQTGPWASVGATGRRPARFLGTSLRGPAGVCPGPACP